MTSNNSLGRPTTRDRLVDAMVGLLQEKGPSASGTAEVLEAAGAPRGSFYHHFPEGKDQLVAAAVARAGAATRDSLELALHGAGSVGTRIEAFLLGVAADQLAHDYRSGCAVGATTLETASSPGAVLAVAEEAFASWTVALTQVLQHAGVDSANASAAADTVVATMEGATMLARARRDPAPLEHAGRMLQRLIDSLVDEYKAASPS